MAARVVRIGRAISLFLGSVLQVLAATQPLEHPEKLRIVEERLLPARSKSVLRALLESGATLSAAAAGERARQLLAEGRRTGDPRALGYAQAALGTWMLAADAPVSIQVLRATIAQSRHDYAAARLQLQDILKLDPEHPQALLTLAAVDLVQGRLGEARKSCVGLQYSDPYLQAICLAEIASASGQLDTARRQFTLIAEQGPPALRAWSYSLLGETEMRAGKWLPAQAALRKSLAVTEDHYTRILLADALLANGERPAARRMLTQAPPTDAVLIRQAQAIPNDDEGRALREEIRRRFAAELARGDTSHKRERALFALSVEGDAKTALPLAIDNWALQREPQDALLLASAAQAMHDDAQLKQVKAWLLQTGLKDARIDSVLKQKDTL